MNEDYANDDALPAGSGALPGGSGVEPVPAAIAVEPPLEPILRRRGVFLPTLLFLATCMSTWWVGYTFLIDPDVLAAAKEAGKTAREEAREEITSERPQPSHDEIERRLRNTDDQATSLYIVQNNQMSGVFYMVSVISILLFHEMGHFLQALRHRVPASWPHFIPMPIGLMGTMGAVIGMPTNKANRRQLFDIGISGPLAGLVVAIPLTWYGIEQAEVGPRLDPLTAPGSGTVLQDPWIIKEMVKYFRPEVRADQDLVLNPFLLAGWVGMLVTGLNMMPISQLDGGHVVYSLFGPRRAHLIAKAFVVLTVYYIVSSGNVFWVPMFVLVLLLGPEHPPTSDDTVELSPIQRLIGLASLAIPFACFPAGGIQQW